MTIPIRGGSHLVIAEDAMVARIAGITAEILCPLKGSDEPRAPDVMGGWFDPERRNEPALPLILVRFTSGRHTTSGGMTSRPHTCSIQIGVHCETVEDHKYAYDLLERIWRDLCEEPYLEGGRYLLDVHQEAGPEWREPAEIAQTWQEYVIELTIPVILPGFMQTRNENGETINYESVYAD